LTEEWQKKKKNLIIPGRSAEEILPNCAKFWQIGEL